MSTSPEHRERRHVLFFRPTLGEGGADRVQLTLLRNLDPARYRVTLVLLRAEGPFLAEVPPWIELHELRAPRLALSVPAFARVLARSDPDVLFCTCSASNIVATTAHALVRSRARLVLSERNALYRGRRVTHVKQTTEVLLKRLLYPRADLVTAVSKGVADELVAALRLPRSRVQIVYNPVVSDELLAMAAAPVEHPWFADAQPPVIVACARLVPQKDYPTLLRAFADLRARVPARLWILGEGPERGALQALIDSLGLQDAARLAGFDKNPFKYMAKARLVMHASRAEGLPGSLIQAQACGAPVVSTDCDFGPREVIEHGVNGFLVPVGDRQGLAARALDLLTSDELHRRMAAAARDRARRFTVEASLARYHDAIDGGGVTGDASP